MVLSSVGNFFELIENSNIVYSYYKVLVLFKFNRNSPHLEFLLILIIFTWVKCNINFLKLNQLIAFTIKKLLFHNMSSGKRERPSSSNSLID